VSGGKTLSFFGFFVLVLVSGEKLKVLKGAVGFRLVANVWYKNSSQLRNSNISIYEEVDAV